MRVGALIVIIPSHAWAISSYLTTYNQQHPGANANCGQCHVNPQGGGARNAYGTQFESAKNQNGGNVTAAIQSADAWQAAQGTTPPVNPPPSNPPPVMPPPSQTPGGTTPVAGARQVPSDVGSCGGGWPFAGYDVTNSRWSPDTAITPGTIGQLVLESQGQTGNGSVLPTLTTQGGFTYAPDMAGTLSKLDASGKAVWATTAQAIWGVPGAIIRTAPALCQGLAVVGSWTNDPSVGATGWVAALRQSDGSVVWKRQIDTDPGSVIFQSPIVYQGNVYVGVACLKAEIGSFGGAVPTCRGSVVALSLSSGQIRWKTYMVPSGMNGGAVWGNTLAIDTASGTLYAGTGNNFSLPPSVAACINGMGGGDTGTICRDPANMIDSLVALDLSSGRVKWSETTNSWDAYNCGQGCSMPSGPDYDFPAGPQLFTPAGAAKIVGAGHKSGAFIALNAGSGSAAWVTKLGGGNSLGGIERECAVDGTSVYCGVNNWNSDSVALLDGTITSGGYWSKLDAKTGRVLWQVANPTGDHALAPVSINSGGVMFGCSLDPAGMCYGLDQSNGAIVWSVTTGFSNGGGVSVYNGRIRIGRGYNALGNLVAIGNSGSGTQVYALPGQPADPVIPTRPGGGGGGSD